MRNIVIFFAIVFTALIGCSQNEENPIKNSTNKISVSKDSADIIRNIDSSDGDFDFTQFEENKDSTYTTPAGNFYRIFQISKDKFKIQWGNKNITRETKDWFYYSQYQYGFMEENSSGIMLQRGCGSPCWINIYLPFDTKYKESYSNCPFYWDINEQVFFEPEYGDTLFKIVSMTSGKSMSIIEKSKYSRSPVEEDVIDSISIENGMLFYRWFTDDEKHTSEKTVQVKLK